MLLPLLPLALLAVADVTTNVTVLRDGTFRGRPIAPFEPPLFNDEQRTSLERIRTGDVRGGILFDAELGWVSSPATGAYGPLGERIADVDDDPRATKRLAVFGGSFTHGDEVEAHEAWPAVIDRMRDDWDVLNLGVGAYGLDQAFLRWRGLAARIDADEVWLGLMPSAVPRVVTVYRPALRHHDRSVSFKPRFGLDEAGDLVLSPNPARTLADVARLIDDQAAFFEATFGADEWVTRWPAAYRPFGSHWTHRSAIARLALTRLEGASPRTADEEMQDVVRAICVTMRREVEAGGARFRVVLLPDRKALHTEPWWSSPALAPARIELDGLAGLALAGPTDLWRPGGHYSPRANEGMALALEPLLK